MESPGKVLVMPETWGGAVTTGNFLARNCSKCRAILEVVWDAETWFAQADWEESALNEFFQKNPHIFVELVRVLPMRYMNSVLFDNPWGIVYPDAFKPAQWQPNDFILHLLRFGRHRVEALKTLALQVRA
jgi:hypothetical protein